MMKKKTLFIINICAMLLFAIYLVTALFIDYPKYVRIIVLSVYFLYAIMRTAFFIKQFRKEGQGGDSPVSGDDII